MSRLVMRQHRIYRVDLQANRNILYIFGDNLDRQGYGGQAGEMRDEPNGFGIATKRSISHSYPNDYFLDGQEDVIGIIDKEFARLQSHLMLTRYDGIVIPADGLGTGLSQMPRYAPEALKYIDALLDTVQYMLGLAQLAHSEHDEILGNMEGKTNE